MSRGGNGELPFFIRLSDREIEQVRAASRACLMEPEYWTADVIRVVIADRSDSYTLHLERELAKARKQVIELMGVVKGVKQ